ncbi:zinc-ribbon domain containing protein [Reinekea sp. G2M2-21]|uniref:zinc-ribbon domain containing protein n=1 Tax=Reinekea sp. G2M2-21 TaxID=2788942 RepID=UPI0018AB6A72|nr:zinc-ribbon domain containing protein [Reinekea sp. G2M2-21]
MKSGRQRRIEIKNKRAERAAILKSELEGKRYLEAKALSNTVVKANHNELLHNNTYGRFPDYYYDVVFNCVECGAAALWTAKAQKWWYEIAKGSIWSTASRCPACRKKRREEKEAQKRHMDDMANKRPHPNEAFFRRKQ